uniref:Uncharacterized protein n=1 Tax=Anguilla anguilla TaxID=7936 RepID=A0A0E9U9P5_ANGAN
MLCKKLCKSLWIRASAKWLNVTEYFILLSTGSVLKRYKRTQKYTHKTA